MAKYQLAPSERLTLEHLPTPMAVYQFVGKHVYTLALSDGFCELFGYQDKAEAYRLMEQDVCYNTHPDDTARIYEAIRRFVAESGRYEVIFRARKHRGNDYRIVHGLGKHIFTQTGERLAYVWFTDEGAYTGDKDTQEAAFNQAFNRALHTESILKESYYDNLTGLPNLSHFFELAEAGKAEIHADGGSTVLLYIDLDGMKYYNHQFGFGEGDKLLQGLAKLLGVTFGNACCCHIGADRFAVYMKDEGLEEILEQLFRNAEKLNGGKSLPVRVGVYSSRMGDVSISYAYDRAKMACDALGKSSSSEYNYYSEELRDHVKRSGYILANLDRAISEKWIQVYYQPIVRAVNEKVCDVEALARWVDPAEGILPPAAFVPYLEEEGLIYKLDLYVLDRVLEKIKTQSAEGIHTVPHSINLSRSDFTACDIVEEIRKRVDAAGVSRKKITIEITESVIGSDFDFMKEQVERFQAYGFSVWMDDFGSGYSSLEMLQSIKFNLLKFDMGFMRKMDDSDAGKIILTELMKMASSLDVDTICEGVETKEQVHFLQEIGCSKLQGYYYSKPIPLEAIRERRLEGHPLAPENIEESAYYETIGRVNLYDLSVIANTDESVFQNAFNTLPMGIVEIQGDKARFVRSNQSYKEFIKRFFGMDLSYEGGAFNKFGTSFMNNIVKTCCEQGLRSFFDEKMADGSVVHSFARRIGVNPVSGNQAVAIAVLSISDADESATYANIARALAADYYNIYLIDLDTNDYIEYVSQVGSEEMSLQRHGGDFFESARRDTMTRIYGEDREPFLALFTKENVLRDIDAHGVFTTTYRLIDTETPMYVNMKVSRMQGGNRLILGVSIVDAHMKQKEHYEELKRERETLIRVMALTDGYLTLFTVDPKTGGFIEYSSSEDFDSLGAAKYGDDFFGQAFVDAYTHCYEPDRERFQAQFTQENVLREIRLNSHFSINYRLIIKGVPRPVTLKAALFKDNGEDKLVVGVRAWKDRKV